MIWKKLEDYWSFRADDHYRGHGTLFSLLGISGGLAAVGEYCETDRFDAHQMSAIPFQIIGASLQMARSVMRFRHAETG